MCLMGMFLNFKPLLSFLKKRKVKKPLLSHENAAVLVQFSVLKSCGELWSSKFQHSTQKPTLMSQKLLQNKSICPDCGTAVLQHGSVLKVRAKCRKKWLINHHNLGHDLSGFYCYGMMVVAPLLSFLVPAEIHHFSKVNSRISSRIWPFPNPRHWLTCRVGTGSSGW